jgi:hypothetical protein
LDCLFVGDGDALPFDLALGHTLPNELCEDIAGEDRWSFAWVRERLQLGDLHLRGAYAWWSALLELDWSARSHWWYPGWFELAEEVGVRAREWWLPLAMVLDGMLESLMMLNVEF